MFKSKPECSMDSLNRLIERLNKFQRLGLTDINNSLVITKSGGGAKLIDTVKGVVVHGNVCDWEASLELLDTAEPKDLTMEGLSIMCYEYKEVLIKAESDSKVYPEDVLNLPVSVMWGIFKSTPFDNWLYICEMIDDEVCTQWTPNLKEESDINIQLESFLVNIKQSSPEKFPGIHECTVEYSDVFTKFDGLKAYGAMKEILSIINSDCYLNLFKLTEEKLNLWMDVLCAMLGNMREVRLDSIVHEMTSLTGQTTKVLRILEGIEVEGGLNNHSFLDSINRPLNLRGGYSTSTLKLAVGMFNNCHVDLVSAVDMHTGLDLFNNRQELFDMINCIVEGKGVSVVLIPILRRLIAELIRVLNDSPIMTLITLKKYSAGLQPFSKSPIRFNFIKLAKEYCEYAFCREDVPNPVMDALDGYEQYEPIATDKPIDNIAAIITMLAMYIQDPVTHEKLLDFLSIEVKFIIYETTDSMLEAE